jgi:hypothetical protein
MPLHNPLIAILQAKIISIARAKAANSGNVAYTGAGFQPRLVLALALCEGASSVFSIGFGDPTLVNALIYEQLNDVGTNAHLYGSALIYATDNGTNSQLATLVSLDADGFTLAWTKVGLGIVADLIIRILCVG